MVGMRMKGMSMVGIADSTKRPPPPAPLSPLPHQPLSLSQSAAEVQYCQIVHLPGVLITFSEPMSLVLILGNNNKTKL